MSAFVRGIVLLKDSPPMIMIFDMRHYICTFGDDHLLFAWITRMKNSNNDINQKARHLTEHDRQSNAKN